MEEKILKCARDSISLNGKDFSISIDYSSISNSEVIKIIINGDTVMEVSNKDDLLKLRNLINSVFDSILRDYKSKKSNEFPHVGGIPSYIRTIG